EINNVFDGQITAPQLAESGQTVALNATGIVSRRTSTPPLAHGKTACRLWRARDPSTGNRENYRF
ncbi:hypothetical protein, partial [Acidocella sp. MX-AZ02]|uniref:hypothetical protein n=1 Tax=Acidocella sp. MX-AZ02 TaxID=1214225 RepID=UPI001969C275